jgi:hypothetical protein
MPIGIREILSYLYWQEYVDSVKYCARVQKLHYNNGREYIRLHYNIAQRYKGSITIIRKSIIRSVTNCSRVYKFRYNIAQEYIGSLLYCARVYRLHYSTAQEYIRSVTILRNSM